MLAPGSRELRVLDAAARLSRWGSPAAPGFARGIARHTCFGTEVAEVVEAGVVDGRIRVTRVWCAIDCGLAVNPDIVAAQMESAIVFGISAALDQEITLVDGVVQQGNFDTYPALRMHECPAITVEVLDRTRAIPAAPASPACRRWRRPSPARCSPPPGCGCAACRCSGRGTSGRAGRRRRDDSPAHRARDDRRAGRRHRRHRARRRSGALGRPGRGRRVVTARLVTRRGCRPGLDRAPPARAPSPTSRACCSRRAAATATRPATRRCRPTPGDRTA